MKKEKNETQEILDKILEKSGKKFERITTTVYALLIIGIMITLAMFFSEVI